MKKRIKISASSCVDMINAFNTKIAELDPTQIEGSECTDTEEEITAAEDGMDYIQGAGLNDQYIQDLMSEVADETVSNPDNPAVCTWQVENGAIIFYLTSIENDSVDEYTCPLQDLTGDIQSDLDYILESVGIII